MSFLPQYMHCIVYLMLRCVTIQLNSIEAEFRGAHDEIVHCVKNERIEYASSMRMDCIHIYIHSSTTCSCFK